jgi:hypothetical protein
MGSTWNLNESSRMKSSRIEKWRDDAGLDSLIGSYQHMSKSSMLVDVPVVANLESWPKSASLAHILEEMSPLQERFLIFQELS